MPNDKKDWYAIAQEAEDEEAKQGGGTKPVAKRKPLNASRSEWYEAAGEQVPTDAPKPKLRKDGMRAAGEALDPNQADDLLQVSAGRKDPPFVKIGIGVGVATIFGLMGWLALRKPPPPAEPEINLPTKNIQNDRMYGLVITPPDGFRQQVVTEPDFLQGIYGNTHKMYYYRNNAAGVDAYYFGELKRDTTLDAYVAVGTDVNGKAGVKPLDAIPEGMNTFPSKGFLIDAGDKQMLYYASKDNDIFVSVYAVAPKGSFDKQSDQVQAAVRALKVKTPTGPHPDKMFAPQEAPE
jgi:hypothetical protein